MFRFLCFVCLAICASCALGKIAVLPDEGIENCVKPEDSADVFDLDSLEILVESDYEVFLNGAFRFKKDIKTWKAHFFTEQFDRGEWTKRLANRKVADFCKNMHVPVELWYNQMKNVKGCPLKAGVMFIFQT